MKIKNTISIALISIYASSSLAATTPKNDIKHAAHERKFYVRGNLLLPTYRNFENYTSRFRVGGSAALGLNLYENFAAELEVLHLRFPVRWKVIGELDNRTFSVWSGFLNLTFKPQLNNMTKLRPFVGIGLGWSNKKLSHPITDKLVPVDGARSSVSNKFTYQLFVGAELELNSTISLLADVRFVDFGKMSVPYTPVYNKEYKTQVQMFSLGMKFKI